MSFIARSSKSASTADHPAAGTHMARLVGITDLGHQPGFTYEGKEIESTYKMEFTYELVNSLMEDGRPHWVSEQFKNNDFVPDKPGGFIATMMARVAAMTPETPTEPDVSKLIGKPCMVTVSINAGGYPKVAGQGAVTGIPVGMDIPELKNDTFTFDMDEPNMDLWDTFPEFKQKRIKEALNFEETELFKQIVLQGDL